MGREGVAIGQSVVIEDADRSQIPFPKVMVTLDQRLVQTLLRGRELEPVV